MRESNHQRSLSLKLLLLSFAVTMPVVAAEAPVPIVYVQRDIGQPQQGPRLHAVDVATEGRLILRQTDGTETILVDSTLPGTPAGTPVDVSDPSVSYDGNKIVFAGYVPGEQGWRIFEVNTTGDDLRQITTTDRVADLSVYGDDAVLYEGFDDVDPCYLPDGRICFVSTRYPGRAPGERLRATNLYVVNTDGTDTHRITTERFGADTPSVDPASGTIVYSRWWLTEQEEAPPTGGLNPNSPPPYYGPVTTSTSFSSVVVRGIIDRDFPGVNNWSLTSIRPDGSELKRFSGVDMNSELTMAYRPAFFGNGDVLALFISASPHLGMPGNHGLREFPADAPGVPTALGGPQTFAGFADLTPRNPIIRAGFTRPTFWYVSAEPIDADNILITGRTRQSGNVDVFLQNRQQTQPRLLFGTALAELDAVPVVARPVPPTLEDEAPRLVHEEAPRTVEEAIEKYGTFKFIVDNIHGNAPVDSTISNAPPIGRDLIIEFYMNQQRPGELGRSGEPILVGSEEIGPDGKVEFELPAGVPLFEVLRRPDGRIALGRDGQPFHVGGMNFGVAGADARCVGCHAGHSQQAVPEDAEWTNIGPSAHVSSSSDLVAQISTAGFRGQVIMAPSVLVDRRTDELISEWAPTANDAEPQIQLRWRKPVFARSVTVHAPRRSGNEFGQRTQVVHRFTVKTFNNGEEVSSQLFDREIRPDGTTVPLDAESEFDVLQVQMLAEDVSGSYLGNVVPALAEIVVDGRSSGGEGNGNVSFIRGDTDCDGRTNVTDAIVIFNALFRGSAAPGLGGPASGSNSVPLCCESSADIDNNDSVNISDGISLLAFMYAGGPEPVAPYPDCEPGTRQLGLLTCDQEFCD